MYIYLLSTNLITSSYIETLTSFILSIIVWYLLNFKMSHLKKLLWKMKSLKEHKKLEPLELKIFNFLFVIIILFPITTVTLNVYYTEYSLEFVQKIFIFNTVFEMNFMKLLARLFSFTAYFITLYQFPMIATIFCCFNVLPAKQNYFSIDRKIKLAVP